MSREERLFAALCAFWLFVAFGLPEAKISLGIFGASRGSLSQGANPTLAEALGCLLGAWALLRGKASRLGWMAAGLWGSLVCVAALRGLSLGQAPKDVAAEARVLLLAPALLALTALKPAFSRLALLSAVSGALFWMLMSALAFLLEPTGFSNPNVVPLPVPALEHALHRAWLFAVLGIWAGLSEKGFPGRMAFLVLMWAMALLTYLRALWLAWILALIPAALWLWGSEGFKKAFAFLGRQALALAGALSLLLLLQRFASPDGEFLLRFRMQRLLQAAHLVKPLPDSIDPGPRASVALRQIAIHGGLFRNLFAGAHTPSASQANHEDPSLSDRALMRREAMAAFAQSPLLGLGLGALFEYQIAGQNRVMRDPHNGYAWLLAKTGLLGFEIAFFLFLSWLALTLVGPFSPQRQALALGLGFLWLCLEWFQPGLLHEEVSLVLALAGSLGLGREGTPAWKA